MADRILIRNLRLSTQIGVPEEERANWQSIALDATLYPSVVFDGIPDDVDHTVDYYSVSVRLREVAESHPRKLIETLANDFADAILSDWAVSKVKLRLKKFILPDTEYVAVAITRKRP